jgi:hypothetical protein
MIDHKDGPTARPAVEMPEFRASRQGSNTEIAIPLLPGDPDVSLNLQAVFDQS